NAPRGPRVQTLSRESPSRHGVTTPKAPPRKQEDPVQELVLLAAASALIVTAFALKRERRLRRALERLIQLIVPSWRRSHEDSPDPPPGDLAARERRLPPERQRARPRSAPPASRSERGDGDAPAGSRRRDARTRRPRRGR